MSGETIREAADALADDLAAIVGPVETKSMFGGAGIFCDGVMFALVDSRGVPHLRADATLAADREGAGAERHGRMPYWTVPEPVRRDHDLFASWAGDALRIARAAKR